MQGNGIHVLLVEDDDSVRESIRSFMCEEGFDVQTARDGQEAIDTLKSGIDLIIADLLMPRVDGRELLRWIGQNRPGTAVILMTGYGTIPQAVEAIRADAAAYITKPLEPQELLLQCRKVLQDRQIQQELARLQTRLRDGWHYCHIIGQSPAMQQVFAMIDRAASVKTTVLITGESGTGKEMIARALHEGGPRKSGPFLALNCCAIPEGLIESTLFGHHGDHTPAPGYFQAAVHGTLLLDEIEGLPRHLQAKLLRVLQDRAITPVGATTPQNVDVRIVATTNCDLHRAVEAGRFRRDLFLMLSALCIGLPPLRNRLADLPLLTRHFVDEICRQNRSETREIDGSLLEAFAGYEWPGNVRELRNTLESIIVLSGRSRLSANDLPERFFRAAVAPTNGDECGSGEGIFNIDALSKQAVLKALEACHGNRREAADRLGISRRTLHRRLNEFGLRDG